MTAHKLAAKLLEGKDLPVVLWYEESIQPDSVIEISKTMETSFTDVDGEPKEQKVIYLC